MTVQHNTRLDDVTLAQRLRRLPGWTLDETGAAITRSFRFADFATAFAFITHVALAAEKADHHPEWSNVWNRVDIRLTTHDAGGITERDIALATQIDVIAPHLP